MDKTELDASQVHLLSTRNQNGLFSIFSGITTSGTRL